MNSRSLLRKKDRNVIAEVRKALPTLEDDAQALAVIAAAGELWDQLAYYGVVDDSGSAEWRRVLPDMLRFIQVQANLGPGLGRVDSEAV